MCQASEAQQPTGMAYRDEQVEPYTATHLLPEAGPLVADTSGMESAAPVQQEVSTGAIHVTIDCQPTLLRSDPASNGGRIEGGDAAADKAEKLGASSMREPVADQVTGGLGEMVSSP